jgi:hypothetical protein
MIRTMLAVAATLTCAAAFAQTGGANPLPVTVDNFVRAETDMYFAGFVKQGALGKFFHYRELPLEDTGVRPNRDTLYSLAVFDLDAGPVTITLPQAGERFMSMLVIDEDHYVHGVFYGAGSHTFSRKDIGTRYLFVALRTFIDPASPQDVEQAHALQDATKVSQNSAGKLEVPNWDATSQKVRDALLVLSETLPDMRLAFGARNEVDPVRHLIGSASAWGGNPDKDAIYLNITPSKNDGTTVYKLTVPARVPVDAFWSVIVYDATGHLKKNDLNAYSLNNITAQKAADGSVAVQFGGCDGKIPNCLPTMPNWNYMVRLYRPRAEILNGEWKFPEAQPMN